MSAPTMGTARGEIVAALAALHSRPTISVGEYALLTGVGPTTVRDAIRRGDLGVRVLRVGTRTRLLSVDVLAQLGAPTGDAA